MNIKALTKCDPPRYVKNITIILFKLPVHLQRELAMCRLGLFKIMATLILMSIYLLTVINNYQNIRYFCC